jgi:hypothetical protein
MNRQPRLLSYSEIETALTCWARWDFQYGGRLAGSTLKPKRTAPLLSEGRAWGAGVAAWHHHGGELLAQWEAHRAIRTSLDADRQRMEDLGLPVDLAQFADTEARLIAMLDHYASTAEPLPSLERIEGEIVVPIPSRSGRRASTRYRFLCYLDGFTRHADGRNLLVEFKLRSQLTPPALIERQRQPRWYAWADWRSTGRIPSGVIVDERLNEVPKPARLTDKGRKPSHAKDQLTTPEAYAWCPPSLKKASRPSYTAVFICRVPPAAT